VILGIIVLMYPSLQIIRLTDVVPASGFGLENIGIKGHKKTRPSLTGLKIGSWGGTSDRSEQGD
jgi:hypothetical protein